MKTARICPTEESAKRFAEKYGYTTAEIVAIITDRSDPKWARTSYAVRVTRKEYHEKRYT